MRRDSPQQLPGSQQPYPDKALLSAVFHRGAEPLLLSLNIHHRRLLGHTIAMPNADGEIAGRIDTWHKECSLSQKHNDIQLVVHACLLAIDTAPYSPRV